MFRFFFQIYLLYVLYKPLALNLIAYMPVRQ